MKKIILSTILILSLLLTPVITKAQANNSDLIISWEAYNFYPSNYSGKAYITNGSSVLLSVTGVIDNNIVNLSSSEISWYIDGSLYKKGVGMAEIIFETTKNSNDSHFIRVVVRGDNYFEKSISLSVKKPQIIIESPILNNTIESGQEVSLLSTPYFFSVGSLNDLSFFWRINNVLQDSNERSMVVNSSSKGVSSGQNLITSIINTNEDNVESATANKTLFIK